MTVKRIAGFDISIYRNPISGCLELSAMVGNRLVRHIYFCMTQKESLKDFVQECKNVLQN